MSLFLDNKKRQTQMVQKGCMIADVVHAPRIPEEIKFSYMRPKICRKFIF